MVDNLKISRYNIICRIMYLAAILAATAAIMSRRRCKEMAVTANYETVMIISMKNGEEGIQALVEKFKTLIEEKATLKNVDEWGKRKLAYLINKESEGYYVLFDFESTAEFPAELDRRYRITEGVMRSLIIKKEDE